MRKKGTDGEVTCGKEETSHLNCWTKFDGERKSREKEKEIKEKREAEKMSEKLHFLSRFYGDRTVDFRRSKRQSSSTRRELRVGTRIQGFRQTMRVRGFSHTRFYSWSKSHSNGMRFLGPEMALQFSPKILGLNVGNVGIVFRQFGTEFLDYFGQFET